MKLASIHVYPVKSMRGLALNEARVETRGLQHDRRWMLVDGKNRFVTARQHPLLLHFAAESIRDGLVLFAPDGSARAVAEPPASAPTLAVGIWKSSSPARLADAATNEWLSHHLGFAVRLVHGGGLPARGGRRVVRARRLRQLRRRFSAAADRQCLARSAELETGATGVDDELPSQHRGADARGACRGSLAPHPHRRRQIRHRQTLHALHPHHHRPGHRDRRRRRRTAGDAARLSARSHRRHLRPEPAGARDRPHHHRHGGRGDRMKLRRALARRAR
ncbi:MAG: MOSC N-terminal beta barrel domain-containing protein [Xanthomonadales bacterium]|nr:MOSC N-terminal beta barrel domain-containing protein [Xanthomonadales bacterium]